MKDNLFTSRYRHIGQNKKHEREQCIVERKYAEKPTDVEIAEVTTLLARFPQDAGDKETGQDKEQINPDPAPAVNPGEKKPGVELCGTSVNEDHGQYRAAANPIA